MSPPIHKDWWLAAALTSATLPSALAQPAPGAGGAQSGVVTTVTQPGARTTTVPLYIDGTKDQRLVTGPNETLHVLFSDQSAMTLGPNSELRIAEFRFDKESKDGRLLVQMTKGFLRVVGGLLSKSRATRIETATATIGIRGGISLLEGDENGFSGTFLFGQEMTFTTPDGANNEIVDRPGFGLDSDKNGISPPHRVDADELAQRLAGLEGGKPPPKDPPTVPTDPAADDEVGGIAPDRVGHRGETENHKKTPTLPDILGGKSPGNQS
jgi:hypothetical protein